MKYIDTKLLKPHEKVDFSNLKIVEQIVKKNNNTIFKPILVDKKSLLVLDGHHRLEIAKKLDIKKVPVVFVDYDSDEIILETSTQMTKKEIVKISTEGKLLSPKSTFHYIMQNCHKVHVSEVF